jgi:hypothetical protein
MLRGTIRCPIVPQPTKQPGGAGTGRQRNPHTLSVLHCTDSRSTQLAAAPTAGSLSRRSPAAA